MLGRSSIIAPPSSKGVNLLANLQLRVLVSPFYQMARRVRGGDREAIGAKRKGSRPWSVLNRLDFYVRLDFGSGEFCDHGGPTIARNEIRTLLQDAVPLTTNRKGNRQKMWNMT